MEYKSSSRRPEGLFCIGTDPTDLYSSADYVLPEVLAFCLLKEPNNSDQAISMAERLLQNYKGQWRELTATLREKYGRLPEHLLKQAQILLNKRRTNLSPWNDGQHAPPSSMALIEMDVFSPTAMRNSITARMQRQRALDDATWSEVHREAKEVLASLKETQQRVIMQEAEIARLTDELAREKSRMEEEERNQKIVMGEIAETVSQLQLELMRLRSSLPNGEGNIETLSEIEYQRHLLRAQWREEADLIQVFQRVLLQHITLYPLSPLREEAHHIDKELCQLLNDPQV
ncbi:uncharacterized protein TM35_000074470 [Trypanosoma theileri]|uniref:Uncharacterized protein n=1 Tax=Trypanosoma theileri TaxID=67003 RepID=A0A1X0P2V0_9TRYP|nr:uncharacterized protein TM35_000074470 [Trypanosoma theileri]ORC91023.1 hypothetical protein TM35_000074470 [Trypanosoma theileri]